MEGGPVLSWLKKSEILSYAKKRRALDAEELVDAVCCVDKTYDLFIEGNGRLSLY